MRFGDVPVGARIRLENFYGEKIEPIQDAVSEKYYASYNWAFYGWNFSYKFYNAGENGLCSLSDDTEVVLL
jgi:hypothetical protein